MCIHLVLATPPTCWYVTMAMQPFLLRPVPLLRTDADVLRTCENSHVFFQLMCQELLKDAAGKDGHISTSLSANFGLSSTVFAVS